MPYRDPEQKRKHDRKYMHELRERRKKETEDLIKRNNQLMTNFVIYRRKARKEKMELHSFIKQIGAILDQPGLSDSEIVKRIYDIKISKNIENLLKSKKAKLIEGTAE